MYTASIKSKELENGVLKVIVEFSDGVTTVEEWCKPQNWDGFKYWVKSRLETFNTGKDFSLADGQAVDVSDPVVVPPTPTQAEIDRNEWFKQYAKWIKIKYNLIDTGIVAANAPQLVTLLDNIKTGFKASYLDYL